MSSKSAEIAGVQVATGHLIGGQRHASAAHFAVRSPIDGRELAQVSAGGPDEVDAAIDAARSAFPAWARLGPEGRGPILRRFAAAIRARGEDLARVETEDNGSLLLGNRRNIVPRAATNIGFFADFAEQLEPPVIRGPVVDNRVRYEPAGVAALITPWNAPLMLSTWKIGPALAAGDTVVLKPPEWAPLTGSLLGDLALEAGVPAGVLNVVQGPGECAGAILAAHPGIARLSFTGSPETARSIARSTAEHLVPVSFELGGKSPFIVFPDADLEKAARTLSRQFINAGQVCLAGTRVLVQASVASELLERTRAASAALPVGDPRRAETRIGPLITPEHLARVRGFVERALGAGARVVFGGEMDACGALYHQPTLLTGVAPDAEIVQREVFGPVLTWQEFEDDDEAVALGNATDYGLAAMVYTADRARAERVAAELVAGTVWVNCYFVRDLSAPFGGARQSGIGREGGRWSFDFFCDVKNVAIDRTSFDAAPEPGGRGDG
ncbi:MAG: aldehyde dehydrogenase [Myxococcota bacterium]